ncbi:MAG: adenylyltransferase/cytidyltransferase family protein [Candidatus Levybacteria bacterium]|nr:adenylyltransferase/cytidyltransferase family protein [Candidatus Levybacteria bacterium]
MAEKILNVEQAIQIANNLRQQRKTIILAGGCFDILHAGHILFLEAAKKEGDCLFVLLESDESVRKRKGKGRPLNSQKKRAALLSSLKSVDFIISLKGVTKNEEYDRLMVQIKPGIVAMTKGDLNIAQRVKQCEMVGAKLKLVIEKIDGISTTALLNQIG